jgi:hypothetical protein
MFTRAHTNSSITPAVLRPLNMAPVVVAGCVRDLRQAHQHTRSHTSTHAYVASPAKKIELPIGAASASMSLTFASTPTKEYLSHDSQHTVRSFTTHVPRAYGSLRQRVMRCLTGRETLSAPKI